MTTPEQRGLANIVQMTEESDYMPKYLPPMFEDAEPWVDVRKALVGWWVDGSWCPTVAIRDYRIKRQKAAR